MNDEDRNHIEGGVWDCAPVSEQPEIVLIDWHVFEVDIPDLPTRTRHFAGKSVTEREGRVSSPIVVFDAGTRRGTTRSGRTYELRGNSGFSPDGEYTWKRWTSINKVSEIVDVTAEIRELVEQK